MMMMGLMMETAEDMVSEMFYSMCAAFGLAWYECEEMWDDMGELIIAAGLEEKVVYSFLSDLAWEL